MYYKLKLSAKYNSCIQLPGRHFRNQNSWCKWSGREMINITAQWFLDSSIVIDFGQQQTRKPAENVKKVSDVINLVLTFQQLENLKIFNLQNERSSKKLELLTFIPTTVNQLSHSFVSKLINQWPTNNFSSKLSQWVKPSFVVSLFVLPLSYHHTDQNCITASDIMTEANASSPGQTQEVDAVLGRILYYALQGRCFLNRALPEESFFVNYILNRLGSENFTVAGKCPSGKSWTQIKT